MDRPLANGLPSDTTCRDISVEAFSAICRLLGERSGFQIERYKDKCMRRRISIRIRATKCATADAYCQLLARDEQEQTKLLQALTIHVSHFFRNPTTFRKIAREILPTLFARGTAERRESLTVWSVGCATGEEPYSLALLLKEDCAAGLARLPVRIFASDINAGVLDQARAGLYPAERLAEVPPALLGRHFSREGGMFRLSQEIRSMVAFRQHDLFAGQQLPRCDLILCRNVLIYFERLQQERLLLDFAQALDGGGFLVLGKSETMVGDARRRFQSVCPVERIYKSLNRIS